MDYGTEPFWNVVVGQTQLVLDDKVGTQLQADWQAQTGANTGRTHYSVDDLHGTICHFPLSQIVVMWRVTPEALLHTRVWNEQLRDFFMTDEERAMRAMQFEAPKRAMEHMDKMEEEMGTSEDWQEGNDE